MTEEEYNDLLNKFTKECIVRMIKDQIKNMYVEPYASIYCKQFDNFKTVLEFIERLSISLRDKRAF